MELQKVLIEGLGDTNIADTAIARCQLANKLEETGEFDLAREALGSLWQGVGQRPQTEGLSEKAKAELLLRAGTLSGWIGSATQLAGSQEAAKDLVSESAAIFETVPSMKRELPCGTLWNPWVALRVNNDCGHSLVAHSSSVRQRVLKRHSEFIVSQHHYLTRVRTTLSRVSFILNMQPF